MTDHTLWQRIAGKPWAWPYLEYDGRLWCIGIRCLRPDEARALIRVACEDWLDANAASWSRSHSIYPNESGFVVCWPVPDGNELCDGVGLGIEQLIAACESLEAAFERERRRHAEFEKEHQASLHAQRSAAKGGG